MYIYIYIHIHIYVYMYVYIYIYTFVLKIVYTGALKIIYTGALSMIRRILRGLPAGCPACSASLRRRQRRQNCARLAVFREFKDVVFEDVVFDNNSFVTLLCIVVYCNIYAKFIIIKHHILELPSLEDLGTLGDLGTSCRTHSHPVGTLGDVLGTLGDSGTSRRTLN